MGSDAAKSGQKVTATIFKDSLEDIAQSGKSLSIDDLAKRLKLGRKTLLPNFGRGIQGVLDLSTEEQLKLNLGDTSGLKSVNVEDDVVGTLNKQIFEQGELDLQNIMKEAQVDTKVAKDVAADMLLDRVNEIDPTAAAKVIKKKGLRGFLETIGGIPLVKSTRKLFNNTLGRIPFIGDIIGLLVDIFIFKEPIGRAAFMAVGGGLGGLLGGLVGSALPGIGTFILGLLGGIAGDFLGGLLYDFLIGGKKPKVDIKERGVRAVPRLLSPSAKDIFSQFSGGGSVPMLAMNGGGSPDIASFASYDNPRNKLVVRFVPIPTSKGSSNSQEGDAIIIKQQVGQPRLIRSLYTGGA